MHLYPRHVDDKFAGIPVNPYKVDPNANVYNANEFEEFIGEMKRVLG